MNTLITDDKSTIITGLPLFFFYLGGPCDGAASFSDLKSFQALSREGASFFSTVTLLKMGWRAEASIFHIMILILMKQI